MEKNCITIGTSAEIMKNISNNIIVNSISDIINLKKI